LQKEIDDAKVSLSESTRRTPESVRDLKESIAEHGLGGVKGPLIDLISTPSELSDAVEALLSRRLAFSFVCTDETDYQLVLKLRNQSDAPSSIVLLRNDSERPVLPDLPAGKGVEGWLWDLLQVDDETRWLLGIVFGEYILTKDIRTAERLATKSGLRTVTRKGLVFIPTDDKILSHPIGDPKGIISTAPLEKRLREAERQLVQSRKAVTDIMSKLETLTSEREELSEILGQITRWSGTWERRKKLSETIPEIEERIVTIDDELKQLQLEFGKAERKLKDLDASQPPERSRLASQQSAIRNKLRRISKNLSEAESGLHAAEKDEALRRQDLLRLKDSVEMYSDRLTELRTELKESKQAGGTILETIEVMTDGRQQMEKKYVAAKSELDAIRLETRTLSEKLVELNLEVRNSRLQVLQAKRQLSNMEHELETVEEALADKEAPTKVRELDKVREELLKVQSILEDYRDVSESVARTEIQLKERLDELNEKMAELQLEVDEASKTVEGIKKDYQDGMNDVLHRLEDKVNEILSGVEFSGQVKLNLAKNDGEYGVEFRTRIRGDDFGSLSAGSGGERSLVAIGLILALQRFNPAPVYALDEIDTFLDATNTEMVSKLLHDSSRRSQFILFTPAKSTHLLKHADKRIGVVSPSGVEPSVIIESPRFSGQ
jgi:chromosome segregation protein